jgi:hypothetical protein
MNKIREILGLCLDYIIIGILLILVVFSSPSVNGLSTLFFGYVFLSCIVNFHIFRLWFITGKKVFSKKNIKWWILMFLFNIPYVIFMFNFGIADLLIIIYVSVNLIFIVLYILYVLIKRRIKIHF